MIRVFNWILAIVVVFEVTVILGLVWSYFGAIWFMILTEPFIFDRVDKEWKRWKKSRKNRR